MVICVLKMTRDDHTVDNETEINDTGGALTMGEGVQCSDPGLNITTPGTSIFYEYLKYGLSAQCSSEEKCNAVENWLLQI